MKSFDGDASGAERRSSIRTPLGMVDGPTTHDNDDSYDLDAMAVSDGFRPATSEPGASSAAPAPAPAPAPQQPSMPQVPPPTADSSVKYLQNMANRPSSLSKTHRPHESLTLHNDGPHPSVRGPIHGPGSSNGASGQPTLRIDSPYRGPSGPSHPYGMYLQRTLSNATDATQSPASATDTPSSSQSYVTPGGPTHPYALYTQNTTSEEENAQEQHIPVGFNGVGSTYRRQLGPDGEESGGLIGPLGHTEELPPYTRYPTEGHSASSHTSPTQPVPTPPTAIAGAGGIGMATRNPEFSSTDEDLSMPYAGPTLESTSTNVSHHDINMAAKGPDEKSRRAKWQRRAKKKMCGVIPYWAICLCTVVIVFTSVIAGAVIGTLLVNDDDRPKAYDEPEFLHQLPEDLPKLAEGNFRLPPLDVSQAPRACFEETTQSQAWSCEVSSRYFTMNVRPIPNNTNETSKYQLTLTPRNDTNTQFMWGTMPPTVPNPAALSLVNDTFEPGRGPAWWLKVTYDKTVTVNEDTLSRNSKREWTYSDPSIAGFDHSQYTQKNVAAVDGERPWICTWPNTTLEIFIYPSQNASIPYSTSTIPAPPGPTPDPWATERLESYPSVVKFLERRIPPDEDSVATCRQVEVKNNGMDADPVLDVRGNPRQIVIEEKEDYRRLVKKSIFSPQVDKRSLAAREVLELTDCGCLWLST